MKHKSVDIDLLLSALLLFSALIGLLYSSRLMAEAAPTTQASAATTEAKPAVAASSATVSQEPDNGLATVSADEALEILQPLIESESIEPLVEEVAKMPLDKITPIIENILGNEEQLFDRSDRLQILFGIADGYKTLEDKKHILDFIIDPRYRYMRDGNPIMYIAATSSYPQIIPVIKEWYSKKVAKQFNKDVLRDQLEMNALVHAVEQKDLNALTIMKKYGVDMTKKRMGILLHDAVRYKVGRDIIEFLLGQGADVNYALGDYTPIMEAVNNNDLDTVKLLVERGADPSKVVNNAVGNALELSEGQERIAIQTYLVDHGARHHEDKQETNLEF